jgi:hypothetical protein
MTDIRLEAANLLTAISEHDPYANRIGADPGDIPDLEDYICLRGVTG